MVHTAFFLLMILALALAICLSLFGVQTMETNILGWFLFALGVVFLVVSTITLSARMAKPWIHNEGAEPGPKGVLEPSIVWLVYGFLVAFLAPPIEWLHLPGWLPRPPGLPITGLVIFSSGILLLSSAYLQRFRLLYRDHPMTFRQPWEKAGPYRLIRHPDYSGLFLMVLGTAIGYSSLLGLVALLFGLIPMLVYRVRNEENRLVRLHGEPYRTYQQRTCRMIPIVW